MNDYFAKTKLNDCLLSSTGSAKDLVRKTTGSISVSADL